MQIHLVQSNIHWERKPQNIKALSAVAKRVAPTPDDLVVAPELFANGFSMDPALFAEPGEDGSPTIDALKSIAAENRCALVGGVAMKTDGYFANEAIAAFPDGSTARYRKHQTFSFAGESEIYTAGDRLTTFDWGGGKIGMTVCYDLRFPEIYRALAFASAELIVNIANWPARRIGHWVKLLQARAIENQCYIAGVNRVGEDPNARYVGRSMVVDPQGEIVADAGEEEGVVSAEIDFELVRSWRAEFPALEDARRGNPPVDHIG